MESFATQWANARRALARATRFLLLRPQRGPFQAPSDLAIGGFGIAALAFWIVLDRLQYGPGALFSPYEAPAFAWYVLAALLVTWLMSRTTRPRVDFRSTLFLIAVVAPVVITCGFAARLTPLAGLGQAVAAGVAVYVITYLGVALRHVTGRPQLRSLGATVVAVALIMAFDSSLFIYPTLWHERSPEDLAEGRALRNDAEELLYSQSTRIDSMVARVSASEGARAQVYFVGFAGVGHQKVFAEEIKLAARRIADRYGSSNRTLLLLNDRRDTESYPLASPTGLKLALKGIASRMNPDQDVLFLALSSHGSMDPELSVSNGFLPLHDLTGSATIRLPARCV